VAQFRGTRDEQATFGIGTEEGKFHVCERNRIGNLNKDTTRDEILVADKNAESGTIGTCVIFCFPAS
jgi:hypothetical protein